MSAVDARGDILGAILYWLLFNIEKLFHAQTNDIDRRTNALSLPDHRRDIDAAMFANEEIGCAQRKTIAKHIAFSGVDYRKPFGIGNIDGAMTPAEIALTGADAKFLRRLFGFKRRHQAAAMARAGVSHL